MPRTARLVADRFARLEFLLGAVIACQPSTGPGAVTIEGELRHGQAYSTRLASGLHLCFDPCEFGWALSVRSGDL